MSKKDERVGAVITFESNVKLEDVKKALEAIPGVEWVHAETFDATYGGPVFYIP